MRRLALPASGRLAKLVRRAPRLHPQRGALVVGALLALAGAAIVVIVVRNFDTLYDYFSRRR